MKINWGTGITIAIILFLIMILTMAIRTSQETVDLVTEDYYSKEIKYQQEINKLKNSVKLDQGIRIGQTDEFIFIVFPESFLADSIKGEIELYRASDKSKDRKFEITLDSLHQHTIPKTEVILGKYNVMVDWRYLDTEFLHKETVLFY